MKKIVELVVKLGDLEFEDVAVDAVAMVENPAIELPFLAFSKDHLFVQPEAGEEESAFVARCVPKLIEEGYPEDQAVAICYSYWEEGFECEDCFDLEDACKPGYTAIGMKPKDGRMVPNCVPVEAKKEEFASYDDYPEYIKEAAQRAIDLNEKVGNKCMEQTGKVRAQQLAQGKPISEETIKRMFSFLSRAETYYKPEDPEACGTIAYLGWGGPGAREWAERKLKQIENERIELAQDEFIKLADSIGEVYDREQVTYIDMTQDKFTNVGDFMKGLGALDLLNRRDIRKEKKGRTMYRYAGATPTSNSRNFCRAMFNMNKLYTRADIQRMKGLNANFGHNGNAYSIWSFKGGNYCQHYWEELTVFEGSDGKLIFLSHGPVSGRPGQAPQTMAGGGRWGFSAIDDEKRIVVGPVLVANKLIKRIDRKTGEEYFVYFSEKTVRDVAELLFKRNLQNRTNIEHASDDTDNDNTLLEQWIVDDPKQDKSSLYGFDVPKGTLMQMRKINNEETWKQIKSGQLKGFSVEGSFLERIAKEEPIATEDQQLSAILDILNNIED